MENDQSIIDFIKSCYPEGLPGEILFYGGSFNPWHDGHKEALLKVREKHVIVIPDRNPLKPINPFSLRESEDKIIGDLGVHQWLYSGFLEKRAHNPTQAWIRSIKQEFPELEIALLMGFDNFAILDRWHNADQLIQDLSRIYVLSRNDCPEIKKNQIDLVKEKNNRLETVFLGNHAFEDLSSTLLRQLKETNPNLTAAI